jgi:hypothetical protein
MPDCRYTHFLILYAIAITLRAAQPVPVLVELFTSEGCSSCPPADLLLAKLEHAQIVPGVTVIALSEHVDYWNHLGWSDPFSSAQMSSRQQNYATRFHSDGPYTPQMVVDGSTEFVGSDEGRATRAVALAARHAKMNITVEWITPGVLRVSVPGSAVAAEVFVAQVYDPDPSQVSRGENSGRRLTHVSVVKWLKRVGGVSRDRPFDTRLAIPEEPKLPDPRLVVFVQERGQGRVLAAAEVTMRQSAGIVAR